MKRKSKVGQLGSQGFGESEGIQNISEEQLESKAEE